MATEVEIFAWLFGQIFQPAFWWFWELLIILAYMIRKLIQPWGKVVAIRLQERHGIPYEVSKRYIKSGSKTFQGTKDKQHIMEPEDVAYVGSFGLANSPVIFYDSEKTRAISVSFSEKAHNPKKGSYNANSTEYNDFNKRQTVRQMVKANATQTPSPMLLVVMLIMGLAVGALLGVLFAPPNYIPIPADNNSTSVATSIRR